MTRLAATARVVVGLVVLVPTAATLRAADWRDYLKRPISPGALVLLVEHPEDRNVLARWEAALRDRNARIRGAAARAAGVSNALGLVPALVAALNAEADPDAGTEEIRAIAALGGVSHQDMLATARRLGPWAVRAYVGMLARTIGLRALTEVAGVHPSELDAARIVVADEANLPAAGRIVRSIGDLPSGLVSDLLKVTGCKLSKDRPLGGAEITYDDAGRARTISFMSSDLASACEQAFRAALRVAYGSPNIRPGIPQVILTVADPEFIACLDTRGSDVGTELSPRRTGSGTITQPRKTHHVNPIYPPRAEEARVQGIVIGEATISTTGCVESVRILQTPDFLLSYASVQAILGWRYTPTLLNGVPLPVIMTVTVTFKLE
ncbi:MAG: energy transducer TonB [Vicinamibacterales bacterium]